MSLAPAAVSWIVAAPVRQGRCLRAATGVLGEARRRGEAEGRLYPLPMPPSEPPPRRLAAVVLRCVATAVCVGAALAPDGDCCDQHPFVVRAAVAVAAGSRPGSLVAARSASFARSARSGNMLCESYWMPWRSRIRASGMFCPWTRGQVSRRWLPRVVRPRSSGGVATIAQLAEGLAPCLRKRLFIRVGAGYPQIVRLACGCSDGGFAHKFCGVPVVSGVFAVSREDSAETRMISAAVPSNQLLQMEVVPLPRFPGVGQLAALRAPEPGSRRLVSKGDVRRFCHRLKARRSWQALLTASAARGKWSAVEDRQGTALPSAPSLVPATGGH